MMKKRLSKTVWYGSEVDTEGNPVVPRLAEGADDLEGLHHGELYLHEADDNLSLWARTLTNQIKPIGGLGGGGSLWKLMETENGEKYLFTEFNVVTQMGITSFADNKNLDLPGIYDGIPIDNQTLYWEEVTDEQGNTSKVLKAIGSGGSVDSVNWDNIEGKPTWIGGTKPMYSYDEISGTPDLTEYALKTDIPSLSGYATQAWVNSKGYATQSWVTGKGYITSAALDGYAKSEDLEDYLPLTGVLPSGTTEFNLQGDLRLQKGTATSGRKLFFGDGLNVYLYESPDNFLNIYAHDGMKIYTQSSKYIELSGKGVKVNNGIITYNESGGYFELDGNLLVTGGITAFADSGAGNQWILDATALSGVTSTSQYKVYSARVTKLLKDEVDEIVDKIAAIKSSFSGLSSSSSASAIGSALNTLSGKL